MKKMFYNAFFLYLCSLIEQRKCDFSPIDNGTITRQIQELSGASEVY